METSFDEIQLVVNLDKYDVSRGRYERQRPASLRVSLRSVSPEIRESILWFAAALRSQESPTMLVEITDDNDLLLKATPAPNHFAATSEAEVLYTLPTLVAHLAGAIGNSGGIGVFRVNGFEHYMAAAKRLTHEIKITDPVHLRDMISSLGDELLLTAGSRKRFRTPEAFVESGVLVYRSVARAGGLFNMTRLTPDETFRALQSSSGLRYRYISGQVS